MVASFPNSNYFSYGFDKRVVYHVVDYNIFNKIIQK